MDLNNAEVCITTQQSFKQENYEKYWVKLAGYSDKTEFDAACANLFQDEKNPVFMYCSWNDIPESFINMNCLCPNIFDLLDALELLEEEDQKCFVSWCQQYRYDLTTDDPYLLISRFQEQYTILAKPEDMPEEVLILQDINRCYSDAGLMPANVFGDNYN